MSRSIRRHPAAEAELFQASDWYEDEAGIGADLLAEVRWFTERIAAAPESFPIDPDLPTVRRARLRRFPYWLVYAVHDAEIYVLAVAHVRREPTYWHGRLEEPEPGPRGVSADE